MNALPLGNQKFFQAAGGDPNIQYHHGYFKFKVMSVWLYSLRYQYVVLEFST